LEPGRRMNDDEREVTVALTLERRRPTHSGTGDGSGKGVVDIMSLVTEELSGNSLLRVFI
jgi:hypothetical protein